MKRYVLQLLIFMSCIFAASCQKIDPFVETDEGANVLGFYLDGTKVTYETSGGFPSEYPYEHCVYARQINADSLEINAILDNYYYNQIYFKIAFADISTERKLVDSDITLVYLYRKTPKAPDEHIDGGAHFEWATTELTASEISFRKWDPEYRILSANFSFRCKAPQFDGSVRNLNITKGNFDVRYK